MALIDRALCTRQEVKDFLNLTPEALSGDQTTVDNLIDKLINAASELIIRRSGREFKTTPQPPVAVQRVFDIGVEDRRRRTLPIGDMAAAPTVVGIYTTETDTLIQDITAYVVPLPRRRPAPWQPYRRISFLYRAGISPLGEDIETSQFWPMTVKVTAIWGFPSVPEDIGQAAVTTAAYWYARDMERFSGTFRSDIERVVLPRDLPDQVRDVVDGYRDIRP